jgi:hypothetical protein
MNLVHQFGMLVDVTPPLGNFVVKVGKSVDNRHGDAFSAAFW